MRRLLFYSLAVTVSVGVGVLVVNFGVRLVSGDDDPIGYLQRLVGTAVAAAAIFGPIALFYCLAVALIAGGIGRASWWVGALAGGLPAVVFAVILNQGVGGGAYVGTPAQLDAFARQSYLIATLIILWSAVVAAALIRPLLCTPVINRPQK